MSNTYFDRNQNLHVEGDVNFVSMGEPAQDGTSFAQVTQKVQENNLLSQAVKKGIKILCDNTAPSARYGYNPSFAGLQCHPGTRIGVQDHIFKWLDDPTGQIAMWMNGPVGIGKSAIAQTVARLAAERGQLSSAFFFSRSDDTRNTTRHLVPTLAYEMTQQLPATLNRVCQTVGADPLVFSSSVNHQIQRVLLNSLPTRLDSVQQPYRVIIIDGLDECHDTNIQQGIIQSFISGLLSVQIIPHKLLIVSRPELHITSAFSAADIHVHVQHLALVSWDAGNDIEHFLRDKLKEIKETHPMKHHLGDTWPDEPLFRELRRRSLDRFAWASCAVRFLALPTHNPQDALRDIIWCQSPAASAFGDLDARYRHILSSLDSGIRFTLQKILAYTLWYVEDDVTVIAEALLEEKSAIEIALIHVPSLIHFDGQFMQLRDDSFDEFIHIQERSGEYYLPSSEAYRAVGIICPLLHK